MKLNIIKMKALKRCMLSSIALLGFYQGTISCEAANVTPVYLGQSSSFTDSDVPPAIKLNESVDGLVAGTYLYRTKYQNIMYYTPVTPEKYRGTAHEPAVNVQYRNWGPWKMGTNRVAFSPKSTEKYYNNVTIKAGAEVQGLNSAGSTVTLGYTSKTASVAVRACTQYTEKWIYFSLTGTEFAGKSPQNIGRVRVTQVSTNEIPTKVYRTNSTTTALNFSYLGNYKDTTDSSHINLETGKWVNSSYAPDGLAGQKGEWAAIGYNSKGESLNNPYFPPYDLHFLGCSQPKYYDWRENPFTEKSTFDSSTYNNDKKALLEKMYDNNILSYGGSKANTVNYYLNRFTYMTHPTKDTAIVRGRRTATTATRQLVIQNEPGDFYIVAIEVFDGNTKVAAYNYDIATNKSTRSNGYNIVKGKTYTVKVQLGNAKNRKVLASRIQATLGITKESQFLSLPSVTSSHLSNVMRNDVANNMGSNVGSKSDFITFNITAPNDAQVFDIYGLVGEGHHGTDNLEYNNDASYVRMYTTEAFKEETKIIESADLKATKIELLDTSNNDAVVFSSDGSVTKNAIIPGKSYKIRYTIKNVGGRPTIQTSKPGSEGTNGAWNQSTTTTSYPTVEIPISYTNKMKVQNSNGTISDVTASATNSKLTMNGGNSQISVYKNSEFTYTTGPYYFSTPYLSSTFTIKATGIANSSTSNDTASTTIQDTYDALVNDVKIFSKYDYVLNGNKYSTYTVSYKAKVDAPAFIKNAGNSVKVNTSINVGNQTVYFEDVLIAKDGYQEFSHTIKNVLIQNDTTGVRATVNINYDKKAYESNYNNNTAQSAYSIIKPVKKPTEGSGSDTITTTDTSNGLTLIGGGVLNNNCLIPRRSNSWTVSHRKHTWSSSTKTHSINGTSYSSPVYSTTGDSTTNKSYTESFKIKSILFKSKDTEGKGNDGWVDLLVSNQASLAKIKAGFGFELKIISEYRTNAIKTQPTPSANTSYSGLVDSTSISYSNELFVDLPGTNGANGTRKVLSSTGYGGTTKGLVVTEKDLSTTTETIKEFTYTIKPSNTLGINSVGKIFIPEGLKDGKYKISMYTPPIAGVASSGKNEYTSLCDRRDVYIYVSGAYTDDLDSNIIQ